MLHLVLGKTGTGKSRWCLEKAAERAAEGKKSLLIVPEQAVYACERRALERLEGTLADAVEVRSFRRLCADILSEFPEGNALRLDAAQKTVLIRRAVYACAGELEYYTKKTKDSSFYQMVGRLFDELRNAGATAGRLEEISASCQGLSGAKFRDIARILSRYEEILEGGFLDDAGELVQASLHAAASRKLDGCALFFDGFSGFTQAEYTFLDSVLRGSTEIFITLCCEDREEEKDSAAEVCRKTCRRLIRLSEENLGIRPAVVRLTGPRRYQAAGIAAAADFFLRQQGGGGQTEGVCVFSGSDPYDEARKAADEIARLVREEDFRYRDVSLFVRDTGRYRLPLCRTFERMGIPYCFDVSDTLECSPAVLMLDCLFEMNTGIRTEPLLRMLKCGVCDMEAEETAVLENYCFVHSVDRKDWLSPFTLNPSGFGEMTEEDRKNLETAENARRKVTGWLEPYLRVSGSLGAAPLLKAAFGVLERSGAADGIIRQDGAGRRSASLSFAMLDRFYRLLSDEKLPREEMRSMLKLLASSTSAAAIPQVLDCVMICDASRSIPDGPAVSFVMGLNEGVFPRDEFNGLLFTMEERDLLLENEIRLAGCFEECLDLESFYLYRAVGSPSRKLYLSWSEGGENAEPCAEFSVYRACFSPEERVFSPASGIVNGKTAADRFADALGDRNGTLEQALLSSAAAPVCEKIAALLKEREFRISDGGTAKKLAGERMMLSASKVEKFEYCRFSYFLNYMLGIRTLEKARMSPIEAGNFIHEVMEKLLQKYDGDLTAPDEGELERSCLLLCDEYADRLLEPVQRTARMMSLVRQIKKGVVRLALRLREEQGQSEFRVSDCELVIGREGQVRPVEYLLEDGAKALLEGKVDRVDTFAAGDRCYIRVVDYKTGTKVFKLEEVLQGVNVQMLLYLFALCRNAKDRYGEDLAPAGVLYMPGDPKPGSGNDSTARVYRMSGLLLDDDRVLGAMERDGQGMYIQPKKNAKGEWKFGCRLTPELLEKLEKRIDDLVMDMARSLREGGIDANPVEKDGKKIPCEYCEYAAVCGRDRIGKGRDIGADRRPGVQILKED